MYIYQHQVKGLGYGCTEYSLVPLAGKDTESSLGVFIGVSSRTLAGGDQGDGEVVEFTLGVVVAVSLGTLAVEDQGGETLFRGRFGEVLGERRLKLPESTFKVNLKMTNRIIESNTRVYM